MAPARQIPICSAMPYPSVCRLTLPARHACIFDVSILRSVQRIRSEL